MENDGMSSGGRLENIKGASYDKIFTTAPEGEGKTVQPAFARGKCTPFGTAYHLSPKGKHVTGFSGRCASLRIQFLCHPEGGTFTGVML